MLGQCGREQDEKSTALDGGEKFHDSASEEKGDPTKDFSSHGAQCAIDELMNTSGINVGVTGCTITWVQLVSQRGATP